MSIVANEHDMNQFQNKDITKQYICIVAYLLSIMRLNSSKATSSSAKVSAEVNRLSIPVKVKVKVSTKDKEEVP